MGRVGETVDNGALEGFNREYFHLNEYINFYNANLIRNTTGKTLTEGFFSLRYFPTPDRVPPDPTPKQTMSTYNWLFSLSYCFTFPSTGLSEQRTCMYHYFSCSLNRESREQEKSRGEFFFVSFPLPFSPFHLSVPTLRVQSSCSELAR